MLTCKKELYVGWKCVRSDCVIFVAVDLVNLIFTVFMQCPFARLSYKTLVLKWYLLNVLVFLRKKSKKPYY
jgi:hypothetical protein